MGTFNTHKLIVADPSLIPAMADKITSHFKSEGYDVDVKVSDLGTYDISLAKGDMFKAVLGLRTALKVTLKSEMGNVSFDAGIGVFGQQVIPSLVMYFVAWPVMLTQAWGLVQQASLDDTALALAESVVQSSEQSAPKIVEPTVMPSFCPNCGVKLVAKVNFCPICGQKL